MFKKYVTLILLTLLMVTIIPIKIFAETMTPVYGYNSKFSRGVHNVCYWIDNSASRYSYYINEGAETWEYNGWDNPIYIQEVDSDYATHMDFYAANSNNDVVLSSNPGVVAYTAVFDDSGDPVSFNSNTSWFFAEIVFNTEKTQDMVSAMHEMGHAFGLAHTSNPYSIMYPSREGHEADSPQECDYMAINYLYDYEY